MENEKKFYVNLVSSYKNYKMLTNKGKVEFNDGVARVEFNSEDEVKSFVKAIEANPALKPYVRVATEAKANEVAKANIASQAATGIKVGAQTSEMPKPVVAQVAIKAAPTSAQVFAKAAEPAANEEAKPNVQ